MKNVTSLVSGLGVSPRVPGTTRPIAGIVCVGRVTGWGLEVKSVRQEKPRNLDHKEDGSERVYDKGG